MSLIFSTTKLTTPGVYTYTVPSGVGEIEMHLWGAGGGDGTPGPTTSVTLDPGKPAKYIPGDSIVVAKNTAIKVPDYVTSVVITAAGGGGGGGGSDGGDKNHWIFGLGGGAAQVVREAVAVTPGQVISTVIGSGGAGGGEAATGGYGKATVVKLDGAPVVTAPGGVGGAGRQVKSAQAGEEVGIPVVTNNTTILAGSGGDGSASGYGSGGSSGTSGAVVIEWEAVTIPAVPSVTTSVSGTAGGKGAGGGYAYSKVRVYPGDIITVAVGKRGSTGTGGTSATSPINFSGGGANGTSSGGGGGGATVLLVNNTVIAVAAGGGGGGAGGRTGYSLTPTSTTSSTSGQKYFGTVGVDNWTVPEGITSISIDLVGAGGGGGGNDSHAGYVGSAGGSVTGTLSVSAGDVITIGVGQGGRPGVSGRGSAAGGTGGTSFNGTYSGGTGGNAGPGGSSGGGGGGGGATVILVNGRPQAIAFGGGGGGGGGNHSNGQPGTLWLANPSYGQPGVSHQGDGGGGGGGGGGLHGGNAGDCGSGDNGGYTGSNGSSLVPSGGSEGTGAAGGAYNGGAGGDGTARISWAQTVTQSGASTISVDNGSSGIGENGLPATNSGVGYNTRGIGQSSGSGSSAGGGGGGGYYGGVAGVSGSIGGGGHGGTNYGTVIVAGTGEKPGGTDVAVYPGGTVGYARLDGAIVFNFIRSFTLSVKKSGQWKLVDQAWVKVANNWKPIYNGWVKVDGVWKLLVANPTAHVVAPTYSIGANLSTVDEGSAVSFTLTTTNVPTGHIIPYTAFGLTSNQLLSGSLTGGFTVGTSETITFIPKIDNATTGPRTFTVELNNIGVRASVVVNDTSLTPLATLTANVATADEGDAVSFTISTTGIANGIVIPYVITGITNSDLSIELVTGNLVVGSDTTRELVLREDITTEGVETMTMRTTGVVTAQASIKINDTSVTPIYTLSGNVSLLEEYYPPNQAIRYTLTTNAPVGETVAYTITGITSDDLSSGSLTGNFVVGTTDYIDLAVAANGSIEGVETLLLSLNNNYGRIATQVSDYYYAFTPTSSSCTGGNAYASHGMPSDYTASYHGQVIWPNGGNNHYVGVRIVPTTTKLNIQTTCDNSFTVYLNQSTAILSGNNWGAWYRETIDVVPGVPIYLSWYGHDDGGLWGVVARITDANGAVVALSDYNWSSH